MKRPRLDDVTLEITNMCQLHCQRCDIWREDQRHEISAVSLLTMLEKLLVFFQVEGVSITGGEPFLHGNISAVLRCLGTLKAKRLIRSFGIYTNGACPARIEEVLKQDKEFIQGMSMGISVDGLPMTHDALRGRSAYARTQKTLSLLRRRYGGYLDVELKFTANEENCHELYDVYALALEYGFRFTPKLVETQVTAYYHRAGGTDRRRAIGPGEDLHPVLRGQILSILKQEARRPSNAIQPKMLRMLLRLAQGGTRRITRCKTPARCLFITSRGVVYPCLYMPPVGSIDPGSLCSRKFFTLRAARIDQGAQAHCPGCSSYHGFLKNFNAVSLTAEV